MAENREEGIKIFSGIDDDEKVTEVICCGILKNGAFVVASCNVGACTEVDVIDRDVEVKASYI